MKKYLMMVLATVLMSTVAIKAQDQTSSQDTKSNKTEVGRTDRTQFTPEKRVEKMATDLGLSETEKASVLTLLKKQGIEFAQFRKDVDRESADYRTKSKELRTKQDEELKAIIGAEKFQKLQAIRDEERKKVRENANK
jgi:hypothetical protein